MVRDISRPYRPVGAVLGQQTAQFLGGFLEPLGFVQAQPRPFVAPFEVGVGLVGEMSSYRSIGRSMFTTWTLATRPT